MVLRQPCTRFEANLFTRTKCTNCFQQKADHSAETLDRLKMNRKVSACGWLYVAPSNIDFSQPVHSARRWQRRYFFLYDTGEFTYSLDNNPDTIPQVSMDMQKCTRVCEADSITGHAHSILVAFDGHVCYVKADTTDEIRLWQSLLSVHVKQNTLLHMRPRRAAPTTTQSSVTSRKVEGRNSFEKHSSDEYKEDFGRSGCSSPSSSTLPTDQSDNDDEDERKKPVEPAVVDAQLRRLRSTESDSLPSLLSSPRTSRRTASDETLPSDLTPTVAPLCIPITSSPPPLPATPPPSVEVTPPAAEMTPVLPTTPSSTRRTPYNTPFHIDTKEVHTLRKGWLMLRGKSEREWSKHWVVLAGLSLKLYKDVWAEDSTEPLIAIDLGECDNVYPSASAKNYGIEIKCRQKRYVLSAMTPGIRDSWIEALKHNLHNPSPSYADGTTGGAASNDALSIADSQSDILRRKKHIAYVAPESHHSNSMLSEESLSEPEDDDEVDGARRPLGLPTGSLSSVSSRSHGEVRSRRDTSPAVQRTPMSRIKERSAEGRHRTHSDSSSVASSTQRCGGTKTLKKMRSQKPDTVSSPTIAIASSISGLEDQVRSLKEQLSDTRDKLEDSRVENERLQTTRKKSDPSLDALRRSLSAAERDIREKQAEYEELQRRLEDHREEPTFDHQLFSSFRSRLLAMLKVQLGVLGKCLRTRALALAASDCKEHLDELTASLARMDNFEGEDDLESLHDLLEDVTVLYDRVGQRLRVPTMTETAVNTDICEDFCEYDYKKNDKEWEAQLTALQNTHESELAALRHHYEHQLKQLSERLEDEEEDKKKEKVTPTESMSSVRAEYEELLEDARKGYEEEVDQLRKEHASELEEEKKATRVALEAVRRAHDDELRALTEKRERRESGTKDRDTAARQSRLMDQMREELSGLTALYTAKCVENAELDERLAGLQSEKERFREERARLEEELAEKERQLEELREVMGRLEMNLAGQEGCLETAPPPPSVPPPPPPQSAPCPATRTEVSVPQSADTMTSSVACPPPPPPATEDSTAVRFRRTRPNRRTDVRFHSNPTIPVCVSASAASSSCLSSYLPSDPQLPLPDHLVEEYRRSLAVPVAERRKFFETIAEYHTPF